MIDTIGDMLRGFLEGIRGWVMSQSWLEFMHGWMAEVNASTIWAILIGSVAAVILLIGFWPQGRREKPPARE